MEQIYLTVDQKKLFVNQVRHRKGQIIKFLMYYCQKKYSRGAAEEMTYEHISETYTDKQLVWWAMIIKRMFIVENGIKPYVSKETYNFNTSNPFGDTDYVFDKGGNLYRVENKNFYKIRLRGFEFNEPYDSKFAHEGECFV